MKKVIFGVFAHPDDEAFMVAGTLLKETRAGAELHLILLTAGEKGANPDGVKDLAKTRLKEWRESGKILGATDFHFLGYNDGGLTNESMIDATKKINQIVSTVLASHEEDAHVEFIAFDFNGITGHVDHIVASRAAASVFYRLNRPTTLRLACLPSSVQPTVSTDWIFMEAGRKPSKVQQVIDARYLKEDILKAMQAHRSQRSDSEANIRQQGSELGRNYFIVKKLRLPRDSKLRRIWRRR